MVDFLAKHVIRIVSGVIIIGAVTVLTNSTLPVASKHKDPGSCSVAMGSTINGQQRLLVVASGLNPGTNYLEAQTGVQSVMLTADATGSISDQSLVYHAAGTYTITFYYFYWSNNKLVQAPATSCSAKF